MSIRICTYPDPYNLRKMPYWDEIKECVQYCASQTMVNGFNAEYSEYQDGQLQPVNKLVNTLFEDWDTISQKTLQYSLVDSALKTISLTDTDLGLVQNSLDISCQEILNGIRLLAELGVKVDDIHANDLTLDQQYLVKAYEKVITQKEFDLKCELSESQIEEAIKKTITHHDEESYFEPDFKLPVVFNGIHQFSPIILRAIETISKYYDVILMFNYNPDHPKVYGTWMNVYDGFGVDIGVPSFTNSSSSTAFSSMNQSAMLGGQLADILEGKQAIASKIPLSDEKILVFDNTTEFSRYVAKAYEEALQASNNAPEDSKRNVLSYMNEQFYAASSNVNDILRIYYPEQFGEQRFLNYPIGRFFVAIANMWSDVETKEVISDLNDVSECLLAGIIGDDKDGKLNETFLKCSEYLSIGESTDFSKLISKLKNLKNVVSGKKIEKNKEYKRIDYYRIEPTEIDALITGLKEMKLISRSFFDEFNENEFEFKKFYKKISDFLKKKVESEFDLDPEFKDILARLLERLDNVNYPDSNSTFSCLKRTMSYYLDQEENPSAKWIVRNFEQIDGDVLRSKKEHACGDDKVYHFCCVSDSNMTVPNFEQYPWPFDQDFFEVNCDVLDWKYQVYITSRYERRNFKRYALIYGLINNRCNVKISYVKNENEKENNAYHLLEILGVKEENYTQQQVQHNYSKIINVAKGNNERKDFNKTDRIWYAICPYKFAMDSLISDGTIYKDHFMIAKYLGIVAAYRTCKALNENLDSKQIIENELDVQLDKLKSDFQSINDAEWLDIRKDAGESLGFYKTEKEIKRNLDFVDCILAGKTWGNTLKTIDDPKKKSEFEEAVNNHKHLHRAGSNVCNTCVDREICPKVNRN